MWVTTTKYFVNWINIISTDNQVNFPNISDISVEICILLCLCLAFEYYYVRYCGHSKKPNSTTTAGHN